MKIIGTIWSLDKLDLLSASPDVRLGHIWSGNRIDKGEYKTPSHVSHLRPLPKENKFWREKKTTKKLTCLAVCFFDRGKLKAWSHLHMDVLLGRRAVPGKVIILLRLRNMTFASPLALDYLLHHISFPISSSGKSPFPQIPKERKKRYRRWLMCKKRIKIQDIQKDSEDFSFSVAALPSISVGRYLCYILVIKAICVLLLGQ